jgi:hypothetical protein
VDEHIIENRQILTDDGELREEVFTEMKLKAHFRELAQAIGFTTAELDENRHGQISKKQRQKLEDERFERGIGLAMLLFILFSALFGVTEKKFTLDSMAAVFAVLVLVAIFLVGRWRHINEDLAQNTVESVNGQVSTYYSFLIQQKYQNKLTVGHMEFGIPAKARALFAKGGIYHAYFSPHSKILLSIEPIWINETQQEETVINKHKQVGLS